MDRGKYIRVDKHSTTDELLTFDIRKVNKDAFINDGWLNHYRLDNSFIISYKFNGHSFYIVDYQQHISLTKTNCNYSGYRYWFICPKCNEKAAILYLKDKCFLCRCCQNLAYTSQRRCQIDRLLVKMLKIRRSIGASSNIMEPIINKPKGMHWKTFANIINEEKTVSQQYANAVISELRLDSFIYKA